MNYRKRAKHLEELRIPKLSNDGGFPSKTDFIEWHGKVAPILNFNHAYYNSFQEAAVKVQTTGYSSEKYELLLGHMDSIVVQAINELKMGVVPKEVELNEKNGFWWYWNHCATSTRTWICITAFTVLSTAIGASYWAGRSEFINQVVDAWDIFRDIFRDRLKVIDS
jgi:hypothetical protein